MVERAAVNWDGLEACPHCGVRLAGDGRHAFGPPFLVHEPGVCRDVLLGRLARIRALCAEHGSCGEMGCTAVSTCDLLRVLDEKQGA